MTDYVNEIYSYLRIMEKNQDIKADYLAGQTVWTTVIVDYLMFDFTSDPYSHA